MPVYDAVIIGGGPAGSSAAISLAGRGARVLVVEEKRMPRGKLCGEFITPECFPTLERLGVMERMLDAGAQKISQVSLVVSNGRSVETRIAEMSNGATWAMSLSRGRFDQILFDRAREVGARCLEAVAVKDCVLVGGHPRRVEALSLADGKRVSFEASLIIDASGRNSRLMVDRRERVAGRRGSRLYAMKAHFKNVTGIDHQVELCFFPQGYGGLARVEDELVNLCFIVDERTLKKAGGDPSRVIDLSLMNNILARERLRGAEVVGKWHSVGPLTFGRRRLSRDGVIAIGDASGMIDPFTGTGIQIALRTGEMVAEAIAEATGSLAENPVRTDAETVRTPASLRSASIIDSVLTSYAARYKREFSSRMRAAGLLRIAAFSPMVARMVAGVLARGPALTNWVMRATRSTSGRGSEFKL